MNSDEKKKSGKRDRRRLVFHLVCLGLLPPLAACGKSGKSTKSSIGIDVVVFSLLDRPILDIYLNDEDLGVAGKYGSTSVVTGIRVPMGEQALSWRLDGPRNTPRNGDTVKMKNKVILTASVIPSNANYLSIHIYPDNTADFNFTEFMPDLSARGEAILEAIEKNGQR